MRITLPLTAPGIAAGAVFVFVLSIGNFVTPDLLGGGKFQMVGNLIYDQFLSARDWPFGSALSMLLIAVMLVLLFAQALAAARVARAREGTVHEACLCAPISAAVRLPLCADRRPDASCRSTGPGCRRCGPDFPPNGTAGSSTARDIIASARNSLIVATHLDPHCHRDRHPPGARRRAADNPRRPSTRLLFAPMIIPDIVLAIALLSFFTLIKFTLGLHSIILAHVVFNIAFVCAVVRARLKSFDWSLVEASRDLGRHRAHRPSCASRCR